MRFISTLAVGAAIVGAILLPGTANASCADNPFPKGSNAWVEAEMHCNSGGAAPSGGDRNAEVSPGLDVHTVIVDDPEGKLGGAHINVVRDDNGNIVDHGDAITIEPGSSSDDAE